MQKIYVFIDRKMAKLNFCTAKIQHVHTNIQWVGVVGVRCFSIAEHFSVNHYLI